MLEETTCFLCYVMRGGLIINLGTLITSDCIVQLMLDIPMVWPTIYIVTQENNVLP